MRLKSPGSDFRSSWMQEPDAGSSELPELSDSIVSTAAVRTAALPRKSRSVVRADVSRDRDAVALPSGSRGSARNG